MNLGKKDGEKDAKLRGERIYIYMTGIYCRSEDNIGDWGIKVIDIKVSVRRVLLYRHTRRWDTVRNKMI